MSSFRDKVINLIIRGRDFFTPEALKTTRSMENMEEAADDLNSKLKTLRDTSKTLAKATELEQYGETLATAVSEARTELQRLTQELEATPGASRELRNGLREAEVSVSQLEKAITTTGGTLEDLGRNLRRGGVDIGEFATEQQRLKTQVASFNAELTRLKSAQKDALQLDELRTNVALAKTEFEGAEKSLKALSQQLDATKTPTRELKDAHSLAKSEAMRAATAYQRLTRDLEQHEAAVAKTGIETKDLGKLEKELAEQIGKTQLELAKLATLQKDLATYDKLSPQLERQQKELEQTRKNMVTLREEVQKANAPQEALADQLGKAARAAGQAQIAYERNEAKLNSLKTALNAAGIDTSQLSAEQARLANAQARAATEADKHSTRLTELRRRLDSSAKGVANFTGNMRSMLTTMATAAGAYVGLDKLWQGFKSVINVGGDFEVLREQLIGVYGDVQAGEKAFEWAINLNKRLPTSLEDVLQAFVMLKNNGMDPMDGTLEKMINANVRYGKGAETLIPIIRQLTQSWGKNRIQAEEAYVLIENGLPVWNLLAEATGKNVAELQKMSEQGKLTREYMVALIDTMGKAGEGVVERRMTTWNTLITKFQDGLRQAQDRVAQSGALDYLKDQLSGVNKELSDMAGDGRLAKFGAEFANFTRAAVEGGKSLAITLYDWRGGIELVAKAWLMFKGLGMVSDVAALASNIKDKLVLNLITASEAMHMTGTRGRRATQSLVDMTSGVGGLGKAVGTLSQSLIGLVGSLGFGGIIVAAAAAGTALVQMAKDIYAVTVEADRNADAAERQRASLAATAATAAELMALYSRYKDTVQLTAEQIRYLSEEERLRYQAALAGQRNYLIAQEQHNVLLKAAGELTREQELATTEGLKKVETALLAFATGTDLAMEQASKSVEDYIADIERAQSVAEGLADGSLNKVFADMGLDLDQISGKVGKVVSEFGQGLETMAQASSVNGEAIAAYLSKAFDSSKNGAEIQLLIDKMQVLHNQGKLVGEPWVQSLSQATEAAKKLAKESATGSELYMQLLKQQKAAAEEAYKSGQLSAEQHARAVGTLNQEIEKTTKLQNKQRESANDLDAAYNVLGVKSAEALDKTAAAAKAAYATIAAGSGKIEQQREAFLAYAEAQLQADKANGRFSDSSLLAQAQSLGLTEQLKALVTSINTTGSEALITAGALKTLGNTAQQVQSQAQGAIQYQSASNKAQTENIKKLQEGTRSATGTMVQFATAVVSANDLAGMSIEQLKLKQAQYQNLLERSRQYLHKSNDEWWSDQVRQQLVAQKTNAVMTSLMIKAKTLTEELQASAEPTTEMITNAERALAGLGRLDKATLSGLRSAIDSAKAKLEALSDSARDTLNNLQDELDQYNNNLSAVEQRRFQQQLEDLRAKLAEAEAARNEQAVADLKKAIALAEQLHQKKLEDIRKEQEAAAASSAEAASASSSTARVPTAPTRNAQPAPGATTQTRRIEIAIPSGKSVVLQGSDADADQLEELLHQLNLSARVSS